MTISLSPPIEHGPDPGAGPSLEPGAPLTIRVSRGTGTGPTRLAAFDAALRDAGVADFNLVRLSSVIPPHTAVLTTEREDQIRGGHGDLLFCVYADAYASTPGAAAWAGVIWSEHEDPALGGLFAEHDGASEAVVEEELRSTMQDMMRARPPGMRVREPVLSSITCTSDPVCAIVLASYRRLSWDAWGRSV